MKDKTIQLLFCLAPFAVVLFALLPYAVKMGAEKAIYYEPPDKDALQWGERPLINDKGGKAVKIDWSKIVEINTSFFRQNDQPQTLEVVTIGFNPVGQPKDQRYIFYWTNLVCMTQLKPVVTKTNDTWFITFSE